MTCSLASGGILKGLTYLKTGVHSPVGFSTCSKFLNYENLNPPLLIKVFIIFIVNGCFHRMQSQPFPVLRGYDTNVTAAVTRTTDSSVRM